MSLSSLVCEAHYAAIGTIVKIDKSYFYLKVEKYIVNQLEFDTLKIQKFVDWNCGRRYDRYKIGQKELVFFRKSNYVIKDYDLIGYGGGSEYELPIKKDSIYYSSDYGKSKGYPFEAFLIALQDYFEIKNAVTTISDNDRKAFSQKSELHKIFIECKNNSDYLNVKIPSKSYISNLEKSFLYQEYENKIYVFNFDIDTVILSVDDAEVFKKDKYFIVKPKDGWTKRWLNVYSIHDKQKLKLLYSQLFEILELPEPRIYFGSYYNDTIYGIHETSPSVAHYLDDMHKDDFLSYELLSYNYIIKSGNTVEKFKVKSERGTFELHERKKKIKYGDQITISDAFVLYPNNTVKKIKNRTVFVGKTE